MDRWAFPAFVRLRGKESDVECLGLPAKPPPGHGPHDAGEGEAAGTPGWHGPEVSPLHVVYVALGGTTSGADGLTESMTDFAVTAAYVAAAARPAAMSALKLNPPTVIVPAT